MRPEYPIRASWSAVAVVVLLGLSVPRLFSQHEMQLHNQIWGYLRVSIMDGDSGKAVLARCYLTDSQGRNWTPSGAITYVKPPEMDFIADGTFLISLPPGRYTIRVERGTEYRRVQRDVEIRPGEVHDEHIQLARWTAMNARGWYSGDLHNHRDWRQMPQILLSEDLNLSPTITHWVWDDRVISIPPPASESSPAQRVVDATHAYSIADTEIERGGMLVVDFLGLRAPIDFQGYMLYPPNTVFAEAAHRQGGYVDAEKISWLDGPALIALGQVDFAGVVYNSFGPYGVEPTTDDPTYNTPARLPYFAMDLYYKLLNCGFRLPASAGTASGVKPMPLGYNRAYVHLAEPFSYDAWFRALKAGRSFATNGPMLFLTVDGREPGDTIQVAPGAAHQLSIHAETESQDELEKLEVVWKGKVIKTVGAPPGAHRLEADFTADAGQTGWFTARAFERPTVTVRFAHTGPVYVRVGDDRGIVPEDAAFFVASMDRAIAFLQTMPGFKSPSDRQATLNSFQKARTVYQALASR